MPWWEQGYSKKRQRKVSTPPWATWGHLMVATCKPGRGLVRHWNLPASWLAFPASWVWEINVCCLTNPTPAHLWHLLWQMSWQTEWEGAPRDGGIKSWCCSIPSLDTCAGQMTSQDRVRGKGRGLRTQQTWVKSALCHLWLNIIWDPIFSPVRGNNNSPLPQRTGARSKGDQLVSLLDLLISIY